MKLSLKKCSIFAAAVALILLIQFINLPKIKADTHTNSNLDVVFLLDASGSMKESDPEELRIEAIKMFLDMSADQGNKFGLVAYSDDIVREHNLDAVNSSADKDNIKSMAAAIPFGEKTDTGLGLKEAVKLMKNGYQAGHRPVIILLSDGKNDPKRSNDASTADLNDAIKTAKDNGYPIYTIGLNHDGTVDKTQLSSISSSTGGKNYITSNSADLPKILTDIYADNTNVNVQNGGSLTGNGSFQDVKINIPNSNVIEANISMLSNNPVELKLIDPKGKEVTMPSQSAYVTTSKKYSMLKIVKPSEGDWTLKVKGVSGDNININLVYNYDLTVEAKITPASIKKGDNAAIEAYLSSNGQKVTDKSLYNGAKGKLVIKNIDNNSTKEVQLTNNGDNFTGKYKFDTKGKYEVNVEIDGSNFSRNSTPINLNVIENAALGNNSTKKTSNNLWFILIAIIILLLGLLIIIKQFQKGHKKGFGRVMLEVKDENTEEILSPQYKVLEGYSTKFSLYEVLGLKDEYEEAKELWFRFGDDSLIIDNKSQCIIEKSGRSIEKGVKVKVVNGERIVIILNKVSKSIAMEFYAD